MTLGLKNNRPLAAMGVVQARGAKPRFGLFLIDQQWQYGFASTSCWSKTQRVVNSDRR